MNSGDLTFHIAFVQGTVQHLLALTWSVIENSGCRFRLVSNGCDSRENQLLRQLANESPRVEFHNIPTHKPLRHGILLDQLLQLETSNYFAFMDSDIYATGPFLPSMLSAASNAKAIFSCMPIWCRGSMESVPQGFRLLKGFHNRLPNGFKIGSTYFAIYDKITLRNLIEETGISFEVSLWDDLPRRVQMKLKQSGHKFVRYDTGKLINILLNLRGHQLCQVSSDRLKHIGGISLDALKSKRGRLNILTNLSGRIFEKLLRWSQTNPPLRVGWQRLVSHRELSHYSRINRRRLVVIRYLSSLMEALSKGYPIRGCFQHEDTELVGAINEMQQDVMSLFGNYRDFGSGLGNLTA